MTANGSRFGFPNLGFGIGLRHSHFPHITEQWPAIDWFEILSENALSTGGRGLHVTRQVAERYPVALHGVSMSIGTTDPIDYDYLRGLKELADDVGALWVSDHVCWTGLAHHNSHDLLPMPYNDEVLAHMVERVRIAQDVMERPLAFENASSYVEFTDTTMSEWAFMSALAAEADCGILLDINNIYVSCFNHGWDAQAYLAGIPYDRVVQFHLAGHTNKGTHIIDTHDDYVIDEVWALFRQAYALSGGRSTLVEWDQDIPPFDVVHAEALLARDHVRDADTRDDGDAAEAADAR